MGGLLEFWPAGGPLNRTWVFDAVGQSVGQDGPLARYDVVFLLFLSDIAKYCSLIMP